MYIEIWSTKMDQRDGTLSMYRDMVHKEWIREMGLSLYQRYGPQRMHQERWSLYAEIWSRKRERERERINKRESKRFFIPTN